MKKGEFNIEFCEGSNSGQAIYVSDKNSGHRLFGGKCWGNINTVASIKLSKDSVDEAIKYLEGVKGKINE